MKLWVLIFALLFAETALAQSFRGQYDHKVIPRVDFRNGVQLPVTRVCHQGGQFIGNHRGKRLVTSARGSLTRQVRYYQFDNSRQKRRLVGTSPITIRAC